nr:MAG TPA: hypothetical protein [Caudoviricetes sp.]
MKKNIIWQNYNFNLDDWQDYLAEYPDIKKEEDKYTLIEELNYYFLQDEKINLYKKLDGDIIVLANIGLWNGRKMGYRELYSNNIADCICFEKNCDYAEWYVDQYGNFKSTQSHHDGTHYLLYRAWKKGITDEQKENVLNAIYNDTISQRTLRRYTESLGKYIAAIYGWKIAKK